MINIYTGPPRSGKGIGITLNAYNHARAGWPILSNMDFFFSNNIEKRTNLTLDLDIIESCLANRIPLTHKYSAKFLLVVIDELMLVMDNRKSLSSNNVGLSYFAAQAAKTQCSILGTIQMKDAMDLRMRTFAQWLTYCQKDLAFAYWNGKLINNIINKFDYYLINNMKFKPTLHDAYSIYPKMVEWLGTRFKTEQLIAPRALANKVNQ